jgi:gluconolactonase
LLVAVALLACTNSAPRTGGQTGAAGSAGAAGSSGGTGGTAGAAGSTGGNAGTSGAAGSGAGTAGMSGAAGSTAGASGGSAAGSPGDGGTNDANPTDDASSPHKQYSCPPPPYAAQQMGASTQVCVGLQLKYNWTDGATWIASQNAFFFSNYVNGNPGGNAGGDLIKVYMDGHCEVWLADVGTNGLAVSATGNLMAACHKTRSITEFNVVTKEARIVADQYMGQAFDSPNDLIVHSNGTIYFSNPNYELGGRPPGVGPAVFRIDPTGAVSLITKVAGEPNGVELSPDEKKLYVVMAGVWNLDDNGVPTTKTNEAPPNADGLSVDCAGNILIQGTNSAFGGPSGTTLLVVGGGDLTVRTFQMTVPGLP